MSALSHTRYDAVAITLHWVMAVAFIGMLASGFTMKYVELPQQLTFSVYQWHKSMGVLLLVAFFLRIGWRLTHPAPMLPASITGIEAVLAKAGHWALYGFMLLMPLSGWVMVSSSVYGLPTIVFGWFEWPHIPGIAANEAVSNAAKTAHWLLAIGFALMITGHVGAVIKHAWCEKENLLHRMLWKRKDAA